jgi:hypothetical protein
VRSPPRITRFDLGISLISFAVLLVELLLTRIFSVTMFYHLSFLVVSLAMLGFGASGLVVHLYIHRFPEARLARQTAWAALAFALTAIAAVGISFSLPVSLETNAGNWLRVGTVYVLCAIPFFAGGIVVSLILTRRVEQANRLYFFDLVGAALGCLMLIPTTNWLGAPSAVIAASLVACIAAAVLAGKESRTTRLVALGLAATLAVVAAANTRFGFYDVRYIKGARQPPTLAMRWNSFSRVDVPGTPADLWRPQLLDFAGYSPTLSPDFRVPEVWLRYDADANTPITHFTGDLSRIVHLRYDVSSTVYQLHPFHNVLVIGPGGGRDILTALEMGSGPVTGVEINPITLDLMRTRFRTFSGGLYADYPGVHVINDEGRSFLRHSTDKYDVIQASLVDTWAASAAGAYALSENNLYTVEAFQDYLAHLTPDGIVSFTRWFTSPPVEALKVVSLAVEAMRRDGVRDPASHVVVVRTAPARSLTPSLGSILLKRSAFTVAELSSLRAWADGMEFVDDFMPDDAARGKGDNEFRQLLGPHTDDFVANYPYDVTAVYDDRPFFFNRVPIVPWLLDKLRISRSRLGESPLGLGAQTLLISLVVTAAFTAALLLLPLLASRRRNRRVDASARQVVKHRSSWAVLFAGLGLGFILVEIVLVQRFSVFLGYPVYSLSVVLFTMLLTSGIGSLVAGRWDCRVALPRVLAAVCGALLVYAVLLPRVLSATLGGSTPMRIAVSVALIAPLGFLMGMPFATGVRRVGQDAKEMVAWAWAVNGGASVFGSALTILISMTYGFTVSFFCGAASYGAALAVVLGISQSASRASADEPEPRGAGNVGSESAP